MPVTSPASYQTALHPPRSQLQQATSGLDEVIGAGLEILKDLFGALLRMLAGGTLRVRGFSLEANFSILLSF